MKAISFIIPSLNSVKYYEKCIESILSLDMSNIEVIPVDAGSTDGTKELIERYATKDERIKPNFVSEKSYGYQCNRGIDIASGEFIAIVESDDYIDSQMYEKMYLTAKECGADWIKSDFAFFNDKPIYLYHNILPSFLSDKYDEQMNIREFPYLIYRDLNLWNGIYRRSFLNNEKIRFNETRGAAFQDISFVISCFLKSRNFRYMKGISYYYRQDNESSSIYAKDTTGNVCDEYEYVQKILSSIPRLSQYEKKLVIDKLFGDFIGSLYRALDNPNWKPGKKLELFQGNVKELYRDLGYQEISNYEEFRNVKTMQLMCEDVNLLIGYIRALRYLDKKKMRLFFEFCDGRDLIIFGAGERGRNLAALLIDNNFNVVALCDNNRSKHGLDNGIPILSPNEVAEKYSKGLFLISIQNSYEEVCEQLVELGIDGGSIICSPPISAHDALEIQRRSI